MTQRFYAIVNPAAGGGRCGKLAEAALERVRQLGIELEITQTRRAGEATEFARAAYEKGFRNFLAVGGDGTSFEIVNGIFPCAEKDGRTALGFLPLGTGNSFLRDFTAVSKLAGVDHTLAALKDGRRRACDIIRLHHTGGDIYFVNLMSLGFPADVGELTNRRFKQWGEPGYILGVLAKVAALRHVAFPHRLGAAGECDHRPCLFLTFSNSKFTGGKMMIAPKADPCDGEIEYVRWAPIGRLRLLWLFPQLFTGTHIDHPLASRAAAQRVEFELDGPVNAMVDGEILRLECRYLEILPGALDVIV